MPLSPDTPPIAYVISTVICVALLVGWIWLMSYVPERVAVVATVIALVLLVAVVWFLLAVGAR